MKDLKLERAGVGLSGGVGGVGTKNLIPSMPPGVKHVWVRTSRRHRVDTVRRAIHALDAQRALVFMNFQSRLQVRQFQQARACKLSVLKC